MSENEELQEALLDLERARLREGKLRMEAEALVAGLAVLTRPEGPRQRVHDLLEVLRRVFTFVEAFVLLLDEDGMLRTAVATCEALEKVAVRPQKQFERVLAGQAVAAFDVFQMPEWKDLLTAASQPTKSALHIPVHAGRRTGMLVCTHHERGFFKAPQTELARRFAPIAGEMLVRDDLERTARQRDRFFTLTLDMMCILDAGLCFNQLSRGWDVLGYDRRDLLGRPLLDLVHPDDRHRTRQQFDAAQQCAGNTFESRIMDRHGVGRWLLWNVAMPGDDVLVYAAARDITDLKETQRVLEERTAQLGVLTTSLQEAAFNDPLTGLRNRRYFKERLDEDVAVVRRAYLGPGLEPGSELKNSDLGILMLDLDFFKRVNDSYGHDAGDVILIQTANRIRASIREVDSAIRWGGEEFLVVLRQVDPARIGMVAERVRAAIRSTPFDLPDGRTALVTCSVGYAHYPLGPFGVLPVSDVLKVADGALYQAKHLGRDRVVGIDEGELGVQAETSAMIHDDVLRGVHSGQLRLISSE